MNAKPLLVALTLDLCIFRSYATLELRLFMYKFYSHGSPVKSHTVVRRNSLEIQEKQA